MIKTAKKSRPRRNQDVRAAIEAAGLRYWWVAEELGIASGTLSNHLRRELSQEEKAEVLAAVHRVAERLGAPVRREVTMETRTTLSGGGW